MSYYKNISRNFNCRIKNYFEKTTNPETKEEFEKISPTAKFVAQERALTDIPYAKEIAYATNAKEIFTELAGDGKGIELLASMFEARFKSVSKILEEKGIKNILEISVGLSPRSLILTKNPEINYIATDLPDVLEEAKKIQQKILGQQNRPNLQFQELDIFDKDRLCKIAESFPGEPIAITLEGLLIYLDREQQAQAAKNIREALLEKRGIWITTDLSLRIPPVNAEYEKLLERIYGMTAKRISDNMFEDEEEIRRFLERNGFEFEKISYADLIDEISCLKNPELNLDKEKTKQFLSKRFAYILRPAEQK